MVQREVEPWLVGAEAWLVGAEACLVGVAACLEEAEHSLVGAEACLVGVWPAGRWHRDIAAGRSLEAVAGEHWGIFHPGGGWG